MNEKLLQLLDLYFDLFKEDFSTIPLLRDLGEEECIKIIEHCLSEHKNAEELKYYQEVGADTKY